jgi:antitoxin component of RelBE/YafQ-DinJ toxin-antitoxin module
MENKQELIQLRVDSDLKQKFFETAQERGESPSSLLRTLMQQSIKNQSGKIAEIEEWQKTVNTMLLEIISVLHKSAFMNEEDISWNIYKESWLPEYLDDMIVQSLQDINLKAKEFSERYWQLIDENYFTSFMKSPPLLEQHLSRDNMEIIRKKILKEIETKVTENENSED